MAENYVWGVSLITPVSFKYHDNITSVDLGGLLIFHAPVNPSTAAIWGMVTNQCGI